MIRLDADSLQHVSETNLNGGDTNERVEDVIVDLRVWIRHDFG